MVVVGLTPEEIEIICDRLEEYFDHALSDDDPNHATVVDRLIDKLRNA